jgi:SAM-dependent methyltransferase
VPSTDWDHNAWYHRLLLRQVPAGSRRVLDVGCGAGDLARALAGRVVQVDALDRSPAMVEAAGRAAPSNLTVRRADAMTVELPAGSYDAVLGLSVLHHLPARDALERMAGWVRPGGVVAAVALPRVDRPRELPREVAALGAHHGLGLLLATARRLTGRPWLALPPAHGRMPVREPELTVRQVRAAAAVLPGVRVRRLLFWRYLLVWTKPAGPGSPGPVGTSDP